MGDRKIEWGVYDPNADLRESHRNLPHRDQAGALTFVTFRLADSMPKHVVAQWQGEPFDHVVRSAKQFVYLQNYIRENSTKGNVPEGEYLFWEIGMPSL